MKRSYGSAVHKFGKILHKKKKFAKFIKLL